MPDDTNGPETDPRSTPVWAWIVIAVLGAALVFTTTFGVIQWRRADDLRQKESQRRAAAATAAQFAGALYTYDYNDLAAAKASVLRFATAKYAKGYAATSPAQQDTIARLKAKESAKVTGTFLTDVVGDRASAVVILDTNLDSTAGKRTGVNYLDVVLVRQGGTWKVDAARPVSTNP